MINWIFSPKSQEPPGLVRSVVQAFEHAAAEIDLIPRKSDAVLAIIRPIAPPQVLYDLDPGAGIESGAMVVRVCSTNSFSVMRLLRHS